MAFLSWHERYRLGHPDIDAQHRKLFELVNHFHEVNRMGLSEELHLVLEDLIAATASHFTFEEALMKDIAFPNMADHASMHAELLRQARDMQTRMKAGGHVGMAAIARFLADWLTNHILREDMDYKRFLKDSGPGERGGAGLLG